MFPRTAPRHPRAIDGAIRLAGAATVLIGWLALRRLVALVHAAPAGSALQFVLAIAGFLLVTGGAMLIALGRHIGDQVAVSPRWRTGG